MANRYLEKDPVRCWELLATVLSYGHTVPFIYLKGEKQRYFLHCEQGFFYQDYSSEEYLLDDIRFALFDENLPEIKLRLMGKEDGPIYDMWEFTFARDGLVEAYNYYNTD